MEITDLPIEMQHQIAMQKTIDDNRNSAVAEVDTIRRKQEVLRMAKEIAMENHRTAPASSVMSATDILAIAADLEAFTVS